MPHSLNTYETRQYGAHEDSLQPLAVIGFSLKFPQDADTIEGFWRVLKEKRDVMTPWPDDRMNFHAFRTQNNNSGTENFVPGAHFLKEDLGAFDASFFSISAVEAASMDVQHRILLEATYHALENAGITMEQAFGSKTGVYSGSMANDYQQVLLKDIDDIPKHAVTGSAQSMIANRLSWFYNLHGPSINMDSACSSSLMAFDFACQGLRNRDCDMAVVTGSSLVLAAETTLSLNNMNMLSPHGQSFSFDARADGYSRGEGFSVVLVKRLRDALRDGDTIRAVVRSTGSNQDGYTPGVTQPSRELQARLIKDTYEKAGLSLQETRFFEAHGTGTPLGDPLEADAIGSTFRKARSKDDPLYLGALKSNIGHLEGGSGLAGLIKTIMVLEAGIIPPNANFQKLNPKIDAEFLNIKFPTECVPWPSSGLRRASVASFGFGGSNSHVVLDDALNYLRLRSLVGTHHTSAWRQSVAVCSARNDVNATQGLSHVDHISTINGKRNGYSNGVVASITTNGLNSIHDDEVHLTTGQIPSPGSASTPTKPGPHRLLIFSAADENGLKRLGDAYEAYFRSHQVTEDDETYLDNLAFTLSAHRSSMSWKSFAILNTVESLKDIGSLTSKPLSPARNGGLAFIFTGQGAQYRHMGMELLSHPDFRAAIELFDEELHTLGSSWSVAGLLGEGDYLHDIDDPEYSQPMTTALQIALYELLHSLSVKPSSVLGHSSGEIAAAYAAGALNLSSACKVSYERGRWASALKRSTECPGAMLSVDLSEETMQDYLSQHRQFAKDIHVACINSPYNVTISGDESSIDSIQRILAGEQIRTKKLSTGVAYHSPHMVQIATEYTESLVGLRPGKGSVKRPLMISSVTGQHVLDMKDVCKPEYWVANMVSPVQFARAMSVMSNSIDRAQTRKLGSPKLEMIQDLVEVGPHAALRRPVIDCLEHNKVPAARGRYHSVLVRQSPASQAALRLIGELYSRGHGINVQQANRIGKSSSASPQLLVDLPSYPFKHTKSYWHESQISKHGRVRRAPKLELLGVPVSDWNPLEPRWRKVFDLTETPWKGEHSVNGKAIYPATGMVVMAVEGAKQVADTSRRISGYRIRDAVFSAPIAIEEDRSQVQLHMRSDHSHADRSSTSFEFRVYSMSVTGWFENCRGFVQVIFENDREEAIGIRQRENMFFQDKYNEALKTCTHHVPRAKMYENFVSNGLIYGPSFQGLDNLSWDGKNTAIGDVRCFQWTDEQTQNHRQSHVAHPTTLDAAGQLSWVVLTKGAEEILANGFAATRIQDMWMANSGLAYPETHHLRVYNKSGLKGLRGTDCSLFALDQAGNLVLQISHFETTTIGGDETVFNDIRLREICCEMAYKPDLSFMGAEQLLAVASHGTVKEEEPLSFCQNLDMALFYFAKQASALERSSKHSRGLLKPHIAKYMSWLDRKIHEYEVGDLASTRQGWTSAIEDSRAMEGLIDELERTNAQGRFFMRVGRELVGIILGLKDPLELMFESGLVEHYYQEMCDTMPCCKQITKYLDVLCHKNPQLKVIEVGAGTGSFTGCILEALRGRYGQYVYTDISGAYFAAAREKFASLGSKISYQLLDVERDAVEQGYEEGSFDVVIAGWVLHATHDLTATIGHVRRLLKPHGKLVLLELTEPQSLRNGFAFGTLPGWWLSTETERQWGPCVSTPEWSQLLLANGFEDVDLVLPDYENPICRESTIIIASRDGGEEAEPASVETSITLLLGSGTTLQATVAEEIRQVLEQQNGLRCQIAFIDKEPSPSIARESVLVFLPELDQSYLSTLNEKSFGALQDLLGNAKTVFWLASSCKTASFSADREMVRGLARVLATEKFSLTFVTLNFESLPLKASTCSHLASQVITSTIRDRSSSSELEYVERNGTLMISRVYPSDQMNQEIHTKTHTVLINQEVQQSPPLVLTVPNPGLLDSLRWEEDLARGNDLGEDEIEIEVQALGINFRDLLVVLGKFNADTVGCECAGTVRRVGANCTELQPGDRVCACVLGCARTYVRCHYKLAVKVPDFLSINEAASLPITGVTAHYSLVTLANLQKEDSILIHSATGGTGQMALQIAQAIGAEVYVTVGTEEKRRLVKELYGVPETHILYSRDISFSKELLRRTDGRGVDVVVNSLSGEALLASWECVAPFGRFIELGKADIQANSKLPMSKFFGEVSFHAVAVDYIVEHRPSMIQTHLRAVMAMLDNGTIKVASPLHLHPVSEVEAAFRSMQSGTNTGKMVLTLSPMDVVPTWVPPTYSCRLDPHASYLIAGGLGGLGRSAARWMSQRGARYIILLSRSGPKSTAAQDLVNELQGAGITVRTPRCDVSCSESLAEALRQCADLPPIKGCLQCTMVLQDCLFESMTWDQWSTSIRSKVPSTWNLHAQLPRGLSFFVMLSSAAGIVGSMGQSNYAAGNSYQDGLAAHRLALGEKAISIDLGWMGDVGIVAENAELTKGKEAVADLAPVYETEFLALLDHYLDANLVQTPEHSQAIIGLVTPAQFWSRGAEPPDWLLERPLFRGLPRDSNEDGNNSGDGSGTRSDRDWADELARASSTTEATGIVVEALVQKLSKATSTPPEDIDRTRPLHVYGVDSLLAVEIRNWFGKIFKSDVAIFDITGQGSLEKVAETAAAHSAFLKKHQEESSG